MKTWNIILIGLCLFGKECGKNTDPLCHAGGRPLKRIEVVFDTDANNELDDQHALAYLLFNDSRFKIKAITTNNTGNGGGIAGQQAEAERVLRMCGRENEVEVFRGAEKNFLDIREDLDNPEFDGHAAVQGIIDSAVECADTILNIIAVGKLTNVALALCKEPAIADRIRIIWLGGNYPDEGEYNLENDIPAMNYILDCNTAFEMVTVRYGKETGTDHVRESLDHIRRKMPGTGPECAPVEGRHGNTFTCFGDYSVDLFNHAKCYGDPPSRALFDLAAVAIVKNPSWATYRSIPAPTMVGGRWIDRPDNAHKILIWENFNKEEILKDFHESMANAR